MEYSDINKVKQLLIKKLTGQLSKNEKNDLEAWEKYSPENQKYARKISTSEFLERAILDNNKNLRQKSWNNLHSQIKKKYPFRSKSFIWARIAATVILLIGIGTIVYFSVNSSQNTEHTDTYTFHPGCKNAIFQFSNGESLDLKDLSNFTIEKGDYKLISQEDTLYIKKIYEEIYEDTYNTIKVPRGGEYIVKLDDETVIYLNSESELKIPTVFSKENRHAYLKGEAYFSVTHDKEHPFIVETSQMKIKVLGTKFNIRCYENEPICAATLVEGAINIEHKNKSYKVLPGNQICINQEGLVSNKEVETYLYTAWKDGRLVFENAPLSTIMNELGRWYNFDVTYNAPDIEDMHFTIDVKKYGDLSKIISLMEKMNKVKFGFKNQSIIVDKK